MKSNPKDADGVLERNVSSLLESGGEPPRISEAARARIRGALLARHGAPAEAPRARRRSPLYAVGIGLAAAAAAAVIATRVVGGDAPAAPGALADGTTWITEPTGKVEVLGPRRVRVSGAALLDVAPGNGPFVVETTRGQIEVLGTRFLVEASAERTTAAVVRGSVALASPDGKVVLHAGEQGVAEPGRTPTRGPAPRLSHLVSWAAQARKRDEHAVRPLRNGTLFAREPNRLDVPESPLPIAKLSVDIVVEDQVARVALDQTFVNPQNLALEGMYRFAIPPDAALQRLAMYVDGTLTESGVVERMAARRIYEDLVYRRVDPALLEWTGTGRLGLRIYPLPARQEKRLVLAYTQSLPKLYDDWTLHVPLPEVDVPVGELAFSVRVKGCANCELSSPSHPIEVQRSGEDAVVSYRATGARLGDSLVLRARDRAAAPVIASHTDGADRYLVVRARPELARAAATYRPRTWVILDDVSASRGPMELRAQADLIDGFLRELDEDDRVAVVAFDVSARTVLPPTRVDDVDRRAVRRALNDEGGAGATSFAAAISEANRLLAGVAPADARIVYLGDGVITSDARNLDALRAQLVGKAQFIGVGVGDGPDTQTLDALAAATGGYATTLDLSDDLGWRAFDLVAALHTTRITRLTARLVDAGGAEIPATTYLRSPQLADGEQLELVTKLAGEGRPVAVELAGVVDGAPWQQRIALDGATHEAGYLPRLWAHRHIAARLLAKHEPVALPPCATEGAGAPQIVSAQICPTEAELREQRDEAIRREVVELGKRYFLLSRHTSLLVLENDEMYRKYGVAKGAGVTWAPYVVPAKIPVVTLAAVATGVADDAELVRSPVPLFAEDLSTFDDVQASKRWFAIAGTLPVQSQTRLELGLASPSGGPPPPPITGAALREAPAASEGLAVRGVGAGGGGRSPRPDFVPLAQTVSTNDLQVGLGHGRLGFFGDGWTSQRARRVPGRVAWFSAMNPRQLNHPADPAYDDLTGFVPALFEDELVTWRKQLAAGGGENPHAIEPGARELLERARRALPAGVYRWGDREIAVDATRRLGWRRTTDANLAETASYDGATLTRRYGELDLDVTAALGDADVALGLAHLPIWIADPAHYARWFEVRLTGPRQISLVPPASAKGAPASGLVIELDAQDRVVSIARSDGGELVRVAWGASGPTSARVLGRDVAVGFTGQAIADAVSWAHGAAVAGVAVELPLRMPAFRAGQARALAVGSAAWRHAMRQWMASLAATSDRATLAQAFAALREHGGVARGELVLASGGLGHGASPAQATSGLAALPDDPAAQYLQAWNEWRRAPTRTRPRRLVTTGLIGALWQLREASATITEGRSAAAVDQVLAIEPAAVQLRLVGAGLVSSRYEVKPEQAARLWDAVAVGRYRNLARLQAAVQSSKGGRYDALAERLAALVADLDLRAEPVRLAGLQWQVQASRRGAAGWELIWTTLRDRVLAGDSYDHVATLLVDAAARPAEVPAILARAEQLAEDPDRRLALIELALQTNQVAWVSRAVEPLLRQRPSAELHQLAAQAARAQGRPADALAHLEAAQQLGASEPVGLEAVRDELGQILQLGKLLAVQAVGPDRDALVRRVVAWGAKWRAIDPANPEIDRLLGELLFAVGDRAGAWRQLSTAIEREPMSGAGYAMVADAFEKQGRIAEAMDYWQQAIVLDQTDPTPRMRKAQALIALGRTGEGDALLAEIVRRRWHPRHDAIVYNARQMVERAKQAQR